MSPKRTHSRTRTSSWTDYTFLYASFDDSERELANQVIGEWVLADDEGLRFDALHLVDVFRINMLAPALRALEVRLASSTAPGAPYEKSKVELILASLGGEAP